MTFHSDQMAVDTAVLLGQSNFALGSRGQWGHAVGSPAIPAWRNARREGVREDVVVGVPRDDASQRVRAST